MDEHVTTTLFTDGVWRPAYEHTDGRQYVIDADGVKVYGVWHYPPGEPTPNVIINAPAVRGPSTLAALPVAAAEARSG